MSIEYFVVPGVGANLEGKNTESGFHHLRHAGRGDEAAMEGARGARKCGFSARCSCPEHRRRLDEGLKRGDLEAN